MSDEFRKSLQIKNEAFSLVVNRERGVRLYANKDRTVYLRIGDPKSVQDELSFHQLLLNEGFPVARILDSGSLDGEAYWLEESLGSEHFGDIFTKEMVTDGSIREESFQNFLRIVQQINQAQGRFAHINNEIVPDFKKSVHLERMMGELPDDRSRLERISANIEKDLVEYPTCYTHGDFSAHNTLKRGVIDFGDHFHGPLGYDIVTAITAPFWFPTNVDTIYRRGYDFTDEQIDAFIANVGTFQTPIGKFNVFEKFNSIFFLRATWWAVGNDRNPKLQAWRYDRYHDVMDCIERGESLYEYWRKNRNSD